MSQEFITQENKQFIEEVMQDKMQCQASLQSPLANIDSKQVKQWNPRTRRVGLIARKIGNYPLWSKDGTKMQTTLLQVHIRPFFTVQYKCFN